MGNRISLSEEDAYWIQMKTGVSRNVVGYWLDIVTHGEQVVPYHLASESILPQIEANLLGKPHKKFLHLWPGH